VSRDRRKRVNDAALGAAFLACLAVVTGSAYADLSIANAPYPDVAWGFLESLVAVWAPLVAFLVTPWLVLRLVARRHASGPSEFSKGCALVSGCLPVVLLGVPAFLASASLVSTWTYRDQVRAVASQFTTVCSEKVGVAGAAPRTIGGPSPLIVLDGDGHPGNWTAEGFQRGWSSLDASQVQVVACIGPDEAGQEISCHYSQGGTWTATTHRRSVTLLSARTGAPEGGQTSTTAAGCPDEKVVGTAGQSQDDPIPWDDYALWRFMKGSTGH
jgi:hypothetical protein